MMLARASTTIANLLWTPISWSIGRIKSRFPVIFGLFQDQDYIFTMKWDECHWILAVAAGGVARGGAGQGVSWRAGGRAGAAAC